MAEYFKEKSSAVISKYNKYLKVNNKFKTERKFIIDNYKKIKSIFSEKLNSQCIIKFSSIEYIQYNHLNILVCSDKGLDCFYELLITKYTNDEKLIIVF